MAEAGLLAGLELAVWLVLVLVHVLQEVQLQGRQEWMRKIGVDHNMSANPLFSYTTYLVMIHPNFSHPFPLPLRLHLLQYMHQHQHQPYSQFQSSQ